MWNILEKNEGKSNAEVLGSHAGIGTNWGNSWNKNTLHWDFCDSLLHFPYMGLSKNYGSLKQRSFSKHFQKIKNLL